ncbi:MAG: HD domain-containing protein [Clostridia bacterium]|nr:HD domain-containing protein [Clostridia bacterium]NCC43641.1 HD domain-containing protein [Clostridia bacterium]
MIARIAEKMIEYDRADTHRINHFMKVYGYASMIGKLEGIDEETQETLEIASLLHDIGIKVSIEKYDSSAGHYQEIEGPALAKELLEEFSLKEEMVERICYLIGHHHTYSRIDGIDYQILVEADFLVNLDEDHCERDAIDSVKKRIFKTESGKKILDMLFENVGA